MASHAIQVVIHEDKRSGWWSAQCLQYDIAMQAKTLDDLIYEIQRVLAGYVAVSKELNIEPFTGLKPAPPVFMKIFDHAKIHVKREPVPFSAPYAPIHSDLRVCEMCHA